jgi:hypothetical protein
MSSSIPVYGTPDGEPIDESIPVYGTPDADPTTDGTVTTGGAASGASENESGGFAGLLERIESRTQRFFQSLTERDGASTEASTEADGVDWRDYPGTFAGDAATVLGELRLEELVARNEQVLALVRRALSNEFNVHWYDNTDSERLTRETNSWGGPSLLKSWTSATWRTTSGLTGIEEREMAAAIVVSALRHQGFEEPDLDREEDSVTVTADEITNSNSVLTVSIGYGEIVLSMMSICTLAEDRVDEFRKRARIYRSRRPPEDVLND